MTAHVDTVGRETERLGRRPSAVQYPDPAKVRIVDRYALARWGLARRTRSAAPLYWR